MDFTTAIHQAHQRMREIGKTYKQYHIEPVTIVGTETQRNNGEITIKAYNAFYYLVNYQNYTGFYILSDTGFFDADDLTQNTIQEFTGLIRIVRKGSTWLPRIGTVPVDFVEQGVPIDDGTLTEAQTFKPIDFVKVSFF